MSSNKIVLRQAPSLKRREPLLLKQSASSKGSVVGEVVGGTAAECVAVCCCFPCGVFNIVVTALYKVPFGIYRRIIRKRRRRKAIKNAGGLMPPLPPANRHHQSCGCYDVNGTKVVHPTCSNDAFDMKQIHPSFQNPDKEAIALENEMWERFYSTGFWRSSSRRDSSSQAPPDNDVNLVA